MSLRLHLAHDGLGVPRYVLRVLRELPLREHFQHVADTRHMVSKYLRDHGLTFREISESLGRINHTTSVHSVKQANVLLEIDKSFVDKYEIFSNA